MDKAQANEGESSSSEALDRYLENYFRQEHCAEDAAAAGLMGYEGPAYDGHFVSVRANEDKENAGSNTKPIRASGEQHEDLDTGNAVNMSDKNRARRSNDSETPELPRELENMYYNKTEKSTIHAKDIFTEQISADAEELEEHKKHKILLESDEVLPEVKHMVRAAGITLSNGDASSNIEDLGFKDSTLSTMKSLSEQARRRAAECKRLALSFQ